MLRNLGANGFSENYQLPPQPLWRPLQDMPFPKHGTLFVVNTLFLVCCNGNHMPFLKCLFDVLVSESMNPILCDRHCAKQNNQQHLD
uniref:Uncharacterized protein n=1 Tax=Anguilla anguilla TaxID=7936 RepID=A0A0E9WUY0_ANGAN